MEWSHLFGRTILERGRQYFNTNRVGNYRKNGDMHLCSVMGTRTYQVKIQFENGRVGRMGCTCPMGRDGLYCKHMAAMLFYMEKHNLLIEEEVFSIQQLALDREPEISENAENEKYSYFDCDAMKQVFSLSMAQQKQVRELIACGDVWLESVSAGYRSFGSYMYGSEQDEMTGVAVGMVKEGKSSYSVKLWFEKNRITQADCMIPGCARRYYSDTRYGPQNLCVHQTALLLLLEQYLYKYNLGDATSKAADSFLNLYRNHRQNEHVADEDTFDGGLNLTLKPRLQTFRDEWQLSFKIAGNKSYVVKDISKLVEQIERKEVVQFGSTTKWPLGIENFSEQGKKYCHLLRWIVSEEKERKKALRTSMGYHRDQDVDIKDSLPLFGNRLDEFFEAAQKDNIEWITGYGKEKKTVNLVCREKKPEIHLMIEKNEDAKGVFQGIRISGMVPELLYTPKGAYFLDETYLNRVPGAVVDELKPILRLARAGEISTCIGRKRLGEFYHHVLPVLREHVSITERDSKEIAKYLPPEAAFAFYLDVEEQDVVCRGYAIYGEKRISLVKTDLAERQRAKSRLWNAMETEKIETFRDWETEVDALQQVRELFPVSDEGRDWFCCDGDETFIYQILNGGVERLLRLGEVHATDRFKYMKIRRRTNISVGVAMESGLLDLSVSAGDIDLQEVLDILASYRKKKKFHRLKNGDFFVLEDKNETLETLSQLLEAARIPLKEFVKGKMQIPAYRSLYLDKMLEACSDVYVQRDKKFKALIKDFKTIAEADFEIPPSLVKTLRNYQETGYRWLRTLDAYGFGGILADDMGLGKTLQIITLLLADRRPGTALVVTPASLVYNWGEEFKRFAPELKVCLVSGTQKERRERIREWEMYDVLVTSYDLLKRDVAEYAACEFTYEVLDEAQYIKNHTTAAAKAVKVIRSRQRFALTGTPIENRLSELWSIFDYLMPGYLYSYDGFRKEFETPIVKYQDEHASLRLKRMVAPFILRRLKEDVLKDLPDKLEEVRYVKAEETQQKLLDGQVVRMRMMLEQADEEEFGRNRMKILAELIRIRQICCDPSLCFEDYRGGSAKKSACIELIQSAIEGEHKILVFSQFTSMLALLEQELQALGIAHYKITGETPKAERLRLVNTFNQDKTPVFLISLKAGGTGLNLTGADMVIHYDPWWNLAVQNQATDRAHRIGQTKVVTVYKMIMKDSIEERIMTMQNTKKNLSDEILSGEMKQISQMNKEELLDLLK